MRGLALFAGVVTIQRLYCSRKLGMNIYQILVNRFANTAMITERLVDTEDSH
jgi:hypothetical protein